MDGSLFNMLCSIFLVSFPTNDDITTHQLELVSQTTLISLAVLSSVLAALLVSLISGFLCYRYIKWKRRQKTTLQQLCAANVVTVEDNNAYSQIIQASKTTESHYETIF